MRAEIGNCYSDCAGTTVIVIRTLNPPSMISLSASRICNSDSTILTLTGTLNGGHWYWYSGSCQGTFEGTGVNLSVFPDSSTYYFANQESEGLSSTCLDTFVIVDYFSSDTTIISSSILSVCYGLSATLSTSGVTLGSGAAWHWYSSSCGGQPEGTGFTLVINPSMTSDYYGRAEGTCNTTNCVTVSIIVTSLSIPADSVTSAEREICYGSGTTLSLSGRIIWGAMLNGTGTPVHAVVSTLAAE